MTGRVPQECQECRIAHPGEGWCLEHDAWHPVSEFKVSQKSWRGIDTTCRAGRRQQEALQQGMGQLVCASCASSKPSREFSGRGKGKRSACLTCEAAHPGEQWCREHAAWLPAGDFLRSGSSNRAVCSLCFRLQMHGTTIAVALERQGVDAPQCAACGSLDRLSIHHDHSCCDKGFGCSKCVVGFLCSPCNVAEGMLKTPERALALYRFMLNSR